MSPFLPTGTSRPVSWVEAGSYLWPEEFKAVSVVVSQKETTRTIDTSLELVSTKSGYLKGAGIKALRIHMNDLYAYVHEGVLSVSQETYFHEMNRDRSFFRTIVNIQRESK